MPTAYPGEPAYSTPDYQGYTETPYDYTPPESFVVTEDTVFGPVDNPIGISVPASYGSSAPVSFNPASMGLAAYLSNIWASAFEVAKNYHIAPDSARYIVDPGAEPSDPIPQKPYEGPAPETGKWWERTKNYKGPLAGAGFLGLFAPAPGSAEYEAYVAKNAEKVEEKKKPPTISPDKTPKVEGNSWSNFLRGTKAGYNLEPKPGQVGEPEDRNVFQESLDKWGAGISNIAKVPDYATYLVIGGAVLLLLLVLKR
jgi:hypothetical protein